MAEVKAPARPQLPDLRELMRRPQPERERLMREFSEAEARWLEHEHGIDAVAVLSDFQGCHS